MRHTLCIPEASLRFTPEIPSNGPLFQSRQSVSHASKEQIGLVSLLKTPLHWVSIALRLKSADFTLALKALHFLWPHLPLAHSPATFPSVNSLWPPCPSLLPCTLGLHSVFALLPESSCPPSAWRTLPCPPLQLGSHFLWAMTPFPLLGRSVHGEVALILQWAGGLGQPGQPVHTWWHSMTIQVRNR